MQQPNNPNWKATQIYARFEEWGFPLEQAVCTERECRDADRIGVHKLFKREFRHFRLSFFDSLSVFLLHTDTLHLWKLGKRVDCECLQKFATKVWFAAVGIFSPSFYISWLDKIWIIQFFEYTIYMLSTVYTYHGELENNILISAVQLSSHNNTYINLILIESIKCFVMKWLMSGRRRKKWGELNSVCAPFSFSTERIDDESYLSTSTGNIVDSLLFIIIARKIIRLKVNDSWSFEMFNLLRQALHSSFLFFAFVSTMFRWISWFRMINLYREVCL